MPVLQIDYIPILHSVTQKSMILKSFSVPKDPYFLFGTMLSNLMCHSVRIMNL